MATKVVYPLGDDKRELHKQLGCMNGIFQLFDRRYLLGQHRHGQNQKRLTPGQGDNSGKEFKNASEKAKEKNPKMVMIKTNQASIETSRISFSSSCSSSTFSSLDCTKRVQTECQIASEPTSPNLHKKQPDLSPQLPDIRDVVKESMTREARKTSVRIAAKDERAGLFMKHVDSPRPSLHHKFVQYDRRDRNLTKLQETSWVLKEVKETSRFSYDERKSQCSFEVVKELPRLSLDSKQNFNKTSMNESRSCLPIRQIQGGAETETSSQTLSQSHEPGSNKRPSSRVVARLMGLESLTHSIYEFETLKIKPSLDDELASSSRQSRKGEEFQQNHVSVSPKVHKKLASPERRSRKVIMREPLQPASQKQEGSDQGSKKSPLKNKEALLRSKNASPSVYGEMEKRLTELEFKTSGKDLRALKQILESMQTTRKGLENKEQSLDSQKSDQPVSPMFKGTNYLKRRELLNAAAKPARTTTDSMMTAGLHKVNHEDSREDLFGKKQVKDQTPRSKKATAMTQKSLSPSNTAVYLAGEKPVLSTRPHRSKNGIDRQCYHRPSSGSSRIKKQSNMQPIVLKTRNPKTKNINTMQNDEQSCSYSTETTHQSQGGDKVSFISESNTSLASQNKLEVTRTDQAKENHRNNLAEILIENKPMVGLVKLTMEQPSPISVLDAFYTEDTPSPVKKKCNAFNDCENLHCNETKWNQVGIHNLVNSTNTDQCSELNRVQLENRNLLIQQIELFNSTTDEGTINETPASPCKSKYGDHGYISEILSASGFLKDLDSATRIVQLHPTSSMIRPDLFHLLEKTEVYTELTDNECHKKNPRSKADEKIRRKLVFDTVNDILFHKLAVSGSSGLWTDKRRARLLNGEKLLKELCSEIDNLQASSDRCIYDEDDEVKSLVSADVNKKSEDWDKCCYEVPGLVLDIERLIFKGLIDEVVNAEVASLQDQPGRHCRQLFPM